MNTAMNIRVPEKVGILWTSWATLSLSVRVLPPALYWAVVSTKTCYHSAQNLVPSQLFFKNVKIKD
jgi:hypothetical protein